MRDAYVSLMRADTWKGSPTSEVLFVTPTLAHHVSTRKGGFSPIIDSLQLFLMSMGIKSNKVLLPIAAPRYTNLTLQGILVNRTLFWARMRDHLCRTFQHDQKILKHQIRAYRRILNQFQPKLVMATDAPKELCIAARQLQIPIFEVHHGFGTSEIPWGWDSRRTNELPNGFLAFDEVSLRTFSEIQSSDFRVDQVPFPYQLVRDTYLIDRALLLPTELVVPEEWPIVLVTLQWGYGGEKPNFPAQPNGLIPQSVLDAVAASTESVYWLFRLHPVLIGKPQFRRRIKSFTEQLERFPNCQWRAPTDLPLWEVIKVSTCHLTMASGSTVEAAAFGRCTLALDPRLRRGHELGSLFQKERQIGRVELADQWKPNEILAWVRRQKPVSATSDELISGDWATWFRQQGIV